MKHHPDLDDPEESHIRMLRMQNAFNPAAVAAEVEAAVDQAAKAACEAVTPKRHPIPKLTSDEKFAVALTACIGALFYGGLLSVLGFGVALTCGAPFLRSFGIAITTAFVVAGGLLIPIAKHLGNSKVREKYEATGAMWPPR